jgi:CDP-diglyceride synthetase
MITAVVALGLAIVGFGALVAGPTAFTILVIALAVVVLVDLAVLLGRAGARPVLPAAVVPGVVLPAMVATDVVGDPAAGWDRIPGAFAVALLLGFALVLVFGRRAGAVLGLAGTAVASLLVGLGASGVILLRGLPDGFAWVLALLLLVAAADGAGPLLRAVLARMEPSDGADPGLSREEALAGQVLAGQALVGIVPALVAVALVSLGLGLLFGSPLEPLVLVLLSLVAVVAALGGGFLQRALALEAGVSPDALVPRIGNGIIFGALDALLIAGPAAYVMARAVSL